MTMKQAAAITSGTPAQPFIDALTGLVQAQADTIGFVVLHRWAEILAHCHFAWAEGSSPRAHVPLLPPRPRRHRPCHPRVHPHRRPPSS
jgi:hypothetical protein